MPQPNILVLFCDQLRRQALSCYGDPNIQTPNIDALANRGVRFDAACSTYPICVPFRFTMMTGEYGHKYNVPGINYLLDPAEHRMLADPFNEGTIISIPGTRRTPIRRHAKLTATTPTDCLISP